VRRIFGTLVALVLALSLVLIPAVVSADLGKCTGWDKVKWENNVNSWKIYLEHWGRTPTTAMTRLSGLCGPDALCGSKCYDGLTRAKNTGNLTTPGLGKCGGDCATCNKETGSLGSCPNANCDTKDGTGSAATATNTGASCPGGCPPTVDCRTDVATNRCVQPGTPALVISAKCNGCWGTSTAMAGKSWAPADLGTNPLVSNDMMNHRGTSSIGGGDWGVTGSNHPECASKIWAMQCNLLVANGVCPNCCGVNKPCLDPCPVKVQ